MIKIKIIEIEPDILITNVNQINYTSQNPCTFCSNNPQNGGNGVCHCTLNTPKIT